MWIIINNVGMSSQVLLLSSRQLNFPISAQWQHWAGQHPSRTVNHRRAPLGGMWFAIQIPFLSGVHWVNGQGNKAVKRNCVKELSAVWRHASSEFKDTLQCGNECHPQYVSGLLSGLIVDHRAIGSAVLWPVDSRPPQSSWRQLLFQILG